MLSRWFRAVVTVVLVASGMVVVAPRVQAKEIPETLAERLPVRADAVAPAFAIDFVGVFWDVPADVDGHAHAADGDHGHGDAPHGEIRLRHGGQWGSWMPLIEDGAQAQGRWTGSLVAADDADAYQIRGIPHDAIRPQAVAMNTTDGPPREVRRRPASAQALPLCLSRYDWGADETLGTKDGRAYAEVQVMTVHHTATSNDDSDPKATVRAIHRYHTVDNGWDDIGYHYLVDEQGRLYEGRWSGSDSEPCESDPQSGPGEPGVIGDGRDFAHHGDEDQLVTGAHTGGYNTGNLGVALLGDFRDHPRFGAEPKDAAVASLENVLAELAGRHGFTREQLVGEDKIAYNNGVNQKTVDAISGHRDFTSTECPGQRLYDRFQDIRENVAAKLDANAAPELRILEPADATTVASGTQVRFSAGVADDDASPADVEWTSGEWSASGGSVEVALADGAHAITATVTDDVGLTDTASVTVTWSGGSTTEPDPSADDTIHVGGLTDNSTDAPGPNWDATVAILVHDGDHNPADNVTVSGQWDDGTSASCTTGGDGTCQVSLRLNDKKATSVTFTVLDISRDGDTYDSSANHDADVDSEGQPTITVTRPS